MTKNVMTANADGRFAVWTMIVLLEKCARNLIVSPDARVTWIVQRKRNVMRMASVKTKTIVKDTKIAHVDNCAILTS